MLSANDQINVLLDFGILISKEKDLDNLLVIMADYAKTLLDADRCSIFLADHESNELYSKVAHGTDEIRFPMSKGIAGFTVKSKEIQIVVDAYNDFRFNKKIDDETGYITNSIVTVPLINHEDEVIGIFQALNKASGPFTMIDAQTLLLISNYAASAIENTHLYESMKESQEKLILKLSTAAEFKDNETSEHTKRVGLYARLIAQHCGMSDEEVELMHITSPMHDAGKIGIADNILLKPGKLSDTEFETMKKHTLIGYDILNDENEMLATAGIIAKQHHEKYDGSGYPQGLKADEINIFARITAIADVFDALTSERPYKKAWSYEDAMQYLKDQSSKHFDPKFIEIFLNEEKSVREIYTTYKDKPSQD